MRQTHHQPDGQRADRWSSGSRERLQVRMHSPGLLRQPQDLGIKDLCPDALQRRSSELLRRQDVEVREMPQNLHRRETAENSPDCKT